MPIRRGRRFADSDNKASLRAAVVNEAFVRRYSPTQDPVGRQLSLGTIVGIVGDIQQRAGWGDYRPVAAIPAAYVPGAQSALAVLLAAVGIYGLVATTVAERMCELGIRIALGASPVQTVRAAALPAVWLAVVGVVLGLVLARGGAGLMRGLVFGVSVTDPVTFALAGAIVLCAAATAALVPSLRILRLNVITALRQA